MSSTLNQSVEAISDWIDKENSDRGEALTWHRIGKPVEEIGEVAQTLPGYVTPSRAEETEAELFDVAFSCLSAIVHLNRLRHHSVPDFASDLHDWASIRASQLGITPGDVAESIRKTAQARGLDRNGHFIRLVASGANVFDAQLGASGQNPRKGRYSNYTDLYNALMGTALDALEMAACFSDYEAWFTPMEELEALGERLVARAGLVAS